MNDRNRSGRTPDVRDPDRDPRDESDRIATGPQRRSVAALSVVVAALGAWIAGSPLVYEVTAATRWNNLVVGGAVLLLAGYNGYRGYSDAPLSPGAAGLATLLGLWSIVAAVAFGMSGGVFWSTLASGLLVAGFAGYTASESRGTRAVTARAESDFR